MGMKNINTDILLFGDAFLDTANDDGVFYELHHISKGVPVLRATRTGKNLFIPELNLILSMNGIGLVVDDMQREVPADAFSLRDKYEICLRLTEASTGVFCDIDTIAFDPAADYRYDLYGDKAFCSWRTIHRYSNIPVPDSDVRECLFALKVLIRKKDTSDAWLVQSAHPVRVIADE